MDPLPAVWGNCGALVFPSPLLALTFDLYFVTAIDLKNINVTGVFVFIVVGTWSIFRYLNFVRQSAFDGLVIRSGVCDTTFLMEQREPG